MLIKSKQDIAHILENGRRMGEILEMLAKVCRPGISSGKIDEQAEKLIIAAGGQPAFKGYQTSAADRPFPATICASFNEEIVHGIPGSRVLKDGDIFSIDIGMKWPASAKASAGKSAYTTSNKSSRPWPWAAEIGNK